MLLLAHGKVIPPPPPRLCAVFGAPFFRREWDPHAAGEERLAVRAALHSARQESGPGAAESREDAAARLR